MKKSIIRIFGILIIVVQSILAQGALDSGLVAFWPFSRNANDSTGHGYNGTVVGAVLTQDRFGRDSMAYVFNGTTSQYIEVADDNAWAFGLQPFTILVWANFAVINQYFLMGQTEGGGSTNKWMIQYEAGMLRFHINSPQTGPLYPVYFPWSPSVNQWYQITVTREGNQYSLYVDSTLRASNQDAHTVPNTNAPLHIGKTEGRGFNGKLDDVRIYNRALSNQEIRNLYSQVLTGVVQESQLPMTFSLCQNYPNPFNPTTHLRFEIAELRFVKLAIYDELGREVTTLVDEELKPGIYEARWDAADYSTGIYYYKLTAGNYSETKRMVLIK